MAAVCSSRWSAQKDERRAFGKGRKSAFYCCMLFGLQGPFIVRTGYLWKSSPFPAMKLSIMRQFPAPKCPIEHLSMPLVSSFQNARPRRKYQPSTTLLLSRRKSASQSNGFSGSCGGQILHAFQQMRRDVVIEVLPRRPAVRDRFLRSGRRLRRHRAWTCRAASCWWLSRQKRDGW